MNKAQADIAYGFTTITRARSGVLRLLADEQRARAVRARRPARRQHPRAAGHGVLRVERRSTRTSSRGRSLIRAGVSPANVDRAVASIDEELARLGDDGLTDEGAGRVAAVPDRLDAARARDQRRHRRPSCRRRSSSASASTTTCGCRTCCGAVTLDEVQRGGARGARSRTAPTVVDRRARTPMRRDRMSVRAVFFDVDFTLIYPGPDVPGRGVPARSARGTASTSTRRGSTQAVASAAPLLDEPRGHVVRRRDLRALHAAHHRGRWVARGPRSTPARARSTTSGRRASTSSSTTTCRRCCGELAAAGVRIGLISNSHRCLASFQSHFELEGLIAGAVSSSEHGCMKPHPSIFERRCELVDVPAGRSGDGGRQRASRHRGRARAPACARCCCTAATAPHRARGRARRARRADRPDRSTRAAADSESRSSAAVEPQ